MFYMPVGGIDLDHDSPPQYLAVKVIPKDHKILWFQAEYTSCQVLLIHRL